MTLSTAILGPGLLGASLALALQRAPGAKVALWARRPKIVEELQARQIGTLVSSDLQTVLQNADVVVLCTPIGVMPELATQIAPLLAPHALVTDVGSVKAGVVAALSPIFAGRARFVGSHPMAGSDRAGHEFAAADLFEKRVCIVTPDAATDPTAVTDAQRLWHSVGADVRIVSPAEHDAMVALVSHLPHLLAATLIQTIAGQNPAALDLHGPGFLDHTRVASGPPEMWAEILRTNRVAVRAGVEATIEKLREITTLLDREAPMTEFLTQAKALRDRLRPSK